MVQLDILGKIYLVQATDLTFFKVNIFPTSDSKRKMAIGTVAIDEKEAMRLFVALKAWFEKDPNMTNYLEIKDLRQMKKVQDEFRIKREEATRTEPVSAENLQKQNMAADGRLQPQELGEIAEIKKKGEVKI